MAEEEAASGEAGERSDAFLRLAVHFCPQCGQFRGMKMALFCGCQKWNGAVIDQKPRNVGKIKDHFDAMEVVRRDLNEILAMTDDKIEQLVAAVLRETQTVEAKQNRQLQQDRANARLKTIDKVITKLYMDNAEGKLDDARLTDMVAQLQKESDGPQRLLVTLEADETEQVTENYQRFFDRARHFTHIEKLDRETLSLFVERIEVGPKELPQGIQKTIHREQPFRQSIRIFYRFIGELGTAPMWSFPLPKKPEVGVCNKIT